MLHILWHGTNQTFEAFDKSYLGLNTNNVSSRRAFFFAQSHETAREYAEFAARNLIPDQVAHEERVAASLAAAAAAERRGAWSEYERLMGEAEAMEAEALNAEPAGATLLMCEIRLDNPMEIDAGSSGLLCNIDEIMDEARAAGHDGLIIRNIHDTPTGIGPIDTHYAIFDAEHIRILERHEPDYRPAEDMQPA